MGAVLSIDLACNRSKDFAVCLIEEKQGKPAKVSRVDPDIDLELSICPKLEPARCAEAIWSYCENQTINVLVRDGPQGWKDPSSQLPFSRHCEKLLVAPGKMGRGGHAKPASFASFGHFSIDLFARLTHRGAQLVAGPRVAVPSGQILVVESFPTSAWRELRILPLPAKRRKVGDEEQKIRLQILESLSGFRAPRLPNHDELQALVAGLAGIAILAGDPSDYLAAGEQVRQVDGVTVEGFIFIPRCPAAVN
jgi:hypothetical protein